MTARPDHQQFADFGAPPVAPSGARRLWPLVKALTTRTIFVAGALAIWQVAAPEAYKPAALFGGFAGAVMTAETNGAADAQVRLQRRMAELNVEMQMRVFRAQTLMQQELQNMAGEQAMTQIADVGCIGGMLVGAIAHAFDDRDWESGAGKVAQGACGVAQAVHVQLTQAQQAIMQGDLTMASAGFDGHDYSEDDAKALVRYFLTLPPGTRGALLAGLDVRNNAVDQNTFGDRILIQYRQTHHA